MFSLFSLSTFDSQITLYYDSFQNNLIFKLTLRFPRNYVFKQYNEPNPGFTLLCAPNKDKEN